MNNDAHEFFEEDATLFPIAIAHVDGDAFFTSVEQALHPELRGKPVVTGKERGIIACASYEAKARGVKRGVSLRDARRLCPDLIVLPGDYEAYSIFSQRLMEIIGRFTPKVEAYSIDEGFADLTGMNRVLRQSYRAIAAAIQDHVRRELEITVSVGLSSTKCLAKIASDFRKPAGLTWVPQSDLHAFLEQVPLADVWGLGPNRVSKLQSSGLRTAADYIDRDEHWIRATLHKPGWDLWRELRGIPVLPVDTAPWRPRHSIGKSRTFWPATRDPDMLYARLLRNVAAAFGKLARYRLTTAEILITLRTQDFKETALGARLDSPTSDASDILPAVKDLFRKLYRSGTEYRATGIVLSRLADTAERQGDLFEDPRILAKKDALRTAIADINARYGRTCIVTATELVLDRTDGATAPETPPRHLGIPSIGNAGMAP